MTWAFPAWCRLFGDTKNFVEKVVQNPWGACASLLGLIEIIDFQNSEEK